MTATDAPARAKSAQVWERDPHDWYVEPSSATRALLGAEKLVGPTLDPCCGGGNIPAALIEAGLDVYGTDLVNRHGAQNPSWWLGTHDFMQGHPAGDEPVDLPPVTNVVMNPPFYRAVGAEAFIRRALSIATGKVCAFVDVRFLAGDKRANGIFAEYPPHRVWVITPRVSCPPGAYLAAGGKASGGTADWCWMVWNMSEPPPVDTKFGWLRGVRG